MKVENQTVGLVARCNAFVSGLARKTYLGQTWAFVCAAVLFVSMFGASAQVTQTNTYPDPSSIYNTTGSSFNQALLWVIGATAVLMVIKWVKRAMGR